MQKKTRRVKRGNKKTRRQQRRVKRHIYEKGGNDAIDCSKCRWSEKFRSYEECPFSCWQQALSIGPLRNITIEPIKDAATSTGTFLGNTASTVGSSVTNYFSHPKPTYGGISVKKKRITN